MGQLHTCQIFTLPQFISLSFSAEPKMMFLFALLFISAMKNNFVLCHSFYRGQCPQFTPMDNFDWDRFSGAWFVTRQFATRSSCVINAFQTDDTGSKTIKKISQIPFRNNRFESRKIYSGKLSTPQASNPADMVLKYPLNIAGDSSFVILDTDYDTSGLICTCQTFSLFIMRGHRRSCSILQRSATEDTAITDRLVTLLDSQLEGASSDFNKIKQDGCNYNSTNGITIDIDQILGIASGFLPSTTTPDDRDVDDDVEPLPVDPLPTTPTNTSGSEFDI